MGIRDQDLQEIGGVYATFSIRQTAGVDDLKDQDLGKAVQISSSNTVAPAADASKILGKLVDLSLTDADNGKRVATVQIAGVMTCRWPRLIRWSGTGSWVESMEQ